VVFKSLIILRRVRYIYSPQPTVTWWCRSAPLSSRQALLCSFEKPSIPASLSPLGAAIMGKLSSSSILPLFLDSRRAWLRSHLRLSRGISLALDTATLASLLSQLVRVIQVSLCQTGELFLEASSSRAPLLFSTLLAVTPATQLFGGIPQPERELALWKEQRESLEERVTPLSGRAITEAALTWLQVSTALTEIFPSCHSGLVEF
jgi:hypothetical protein